MSMAHSDFLLLVASVLDEVEENISDGTLARLHAIFGPMLVSAMMLVDRRDVVKVNIGGRSIYQVTSSAGAPYTLYLNLPPRQQMTLDIEDEDGTSTEDAENAEKLVQRARALKAAEALSTMYCPCVGYAFNAMTGDKTVICKHILAVILAHKMGKLMETTVGLPAVAALLGIGSTSHA